MTTPSRIKGKTLGERGEEITEKEGCIQVANFSTPRYDWSIFLRLFDITLGYFLWDIILHNLCPALIYICNSLSPFIFGFLKWNTKLLTLSGSPHHPVPIGLINYDIYFLAQISVFCTLCDRKTHMVGKCTKNKQAYLWNKNMTCYLHIK